MKNKTLVGGCLCGACRYEVQGPPLDAGFCHCRLCQRSAGAPVLAWGTWRAAAFRWTAGQAKAFASSAKARRFFCDACGTQMLFRVSLESQSIDITLASLDQPEQIKPEYHVWTASRLSWFDSADNLPRHSDDGPDTWT